jgi:hypothetical protein
VNGGSSSKDERLRSRSSYGYRFFVSVRIFGIVGLLDRFKVIVILLLADDDVDEFERDKGTPPG